MKSYNYQTAGTFTVTTTGNIDNLDFQKCSVIRMENATLATIRGLKAGYPGQEVTIVSVGAGQVNLAHANTGSSAANRLINTVTSGIAPLVAGLGSAIYKYDEVTSRWRLVTHNQGTWIDIPFDAANFTASAGTWTLTSGDQIVLRYKIDENTFYLNFFLTTTSVSNLGALLRITLPNGYTVNASAGTFQYHRAVDNGGVAVLALAAVAGGGTFIELYATIAATGFTIAANTTQVVGLITIELN